MSLYVYGVMRADASGDRLGPGVGDPPGDVERVCEGPLAALVTTVPDEPIATRRANLLAHGEVLRRAMDAGTVLPMRFGIVMPDEQTVRRDLLSDDRLEAALTELDGRVELELRASYREDAVLREIVAEDPAIADLRRRTEGMPEAATHFDRIHLGELVAGALELKRTSDEAQILEALSPLAVAVSSGDALQQWDVMNAAFLVQRDRLEEFDAAVERVSRERAERMHFRLVGPLPPYSFVARLEETAWA